VGERIEERRKRGEERLPRGLRRRSRPPKAGPSLTEKTVSEILFDSPKLRKQGRWSE